ncbi:hypothetical protein [Streptomyces sp. NBC_01508]|uniref:hypothetical protein n=1 Tax=Streptomyces sp. NBC_01508 TaxID=2903888 RepID=UPI003870E26C
MARVVSRRCDADADNSARSDQVGFPMSEQSASVAPPVRFDTAWCATGLGDYRACRFTYEYYSYESLPPLDSDRFTGAFRWLGDLGEPIPHQVTRLDGLAKELSARGLTLPPDFVTFQTGANLHGSLDKVSATGCWTNISDPLPSPVEPGAYLVRFLQDQQDCVTWYLYLRPSSEAFVVHSEIDYEYEYEARREGEESGADLDDAEKQRAALLWCAPSFEEFAYRFWIENRLWHATNGGGSPQLEPRLRDYLEHYAPPAAST